MKSVFLVARKAIPTAKSGKTYLSVTFHDKTGELEARAFDKIEELAAAASTRRTYVEVEGAVGMFQGKPQLRIETRGEGRPGRARRRPSSPGRRRPSRRSPRRTGPRGRASGRWRELVALVGAVVDPHVKTLIRPSSTTTTWPRGCGARPPRRRVHHAYPGGLLEHTVSCLKLAHRLADHYPQVDRDLLVAGAFFHDLGKIRELSCDRGIEYSDEGRLVGHLVMTAQWIHDKARRVGVPARPRAPRGAHRARRTTASSSTARPRCR